MDHGPVRVGERGKGSACRINLTAEPFAPNLPTAQLHWIISDKSGSITLESVSDGIFVYDNPVGVLTNNPPFPIQLFNLNNYMGLSVDNPGKPLFRSGLS